MRLLGTRGPEVSGICKQNNQNGNKHTHRPACFVGDTDSFYGTCRAASVTTVTYVYRSVTRHVAVALCAPHPASRLRHHVLEPRHPPRPHPGDHRAVVRLVLPGLCPMSVSHVCVRLTDVTRHEALEVCDVVASFVLPDGRVASHVGHGFSCLSVPRGTL